MSGYQDIYAVDHRAINMAVSQSLKQSVYKRSLVFRMIIQFSFIEHKIYVMVRDAIVIVTYALNILDVIADVTKTIQPLLLTATHLT